MRTGYHHPQPFHGQFQRSGPTVPTHLGLHPGNLVLLLPQQPLQVGQLRFVGSMLGLCRSDALLARCEAGLVRSNVCCTGQGGRGAW